MEDVAVDVDQRRAIVTALDLMHFPELVVQRFAGHQRIPHQRLSMPLRLVGTDAMACKQITQIHIFYSKHSHKEYDQL
ncbi:hypothetical protein D3C76_1692450 [compost metagenome]